MNISKVGNLFTNTQAQKAQAVPQKALSKTQELVQGAVKEMQEAGCKKITQHTSKNGTEVVLGYLGQDSAKFSHSCTFKPNGDIIGKSYRDSSLLLPMDTKIRKVNTVLHRNEEPIVEKFSQYSYFGTESVKSKIPTAVEKTTVGLKSGIKRIFEQSKSNGGSIRATEYPSGNTHILRKDLKGNVLERSVTKEKIISGASAGGGGSAFVNLNTLV